MFVKKESLTLGNGNYLLVNDTPVYHKEFVKAQKEAEILCLIAEKAKGLSFKTVKGADINDIRDAVIKELNTKSVNIFKTPEAPKQDLVDKLTKQALDFTKYVQEKERIESLNEKIKPFLIINTFENTGLYFEKDMCELNKIYTIEEIKNAMLILSEKLD